MCHAMAARVLALVFGLLSLSAGAALGADYHVDYAKGDDRNDGLAPDRAWRHAPGDANAAARPAATRLQPGDRLLFAAGVRYRGHIKLNGSGAPDRPIVLTSGPGGSPGIIDGSDPVAGLRPCRSAAECGGSPIWDKLSLIDIGQPFPPTAGLFTEAGQLFPVQSPTPSNPLNADNVQEYLKTDQSGPPQGLVQLPSALARAIADGGRARLIVELYANEIAVRDITAIDGDTARFDAQGLRFNTNMPVRFAVLAHPGLIRRPGEYGLLPDGVQAVAYLPPDARTVSVATGRSGINITSQSHITIAGLDFENMADEPSNPFAGVAIFKSANGSDVTIAQNRFRNFRLSRGNGPVAVNFVRRLTIRDNSFQALAFGSAIRLGRDEDVEISGNVISQIGRTGIMLINTRNAVVRRNTITKAHGIHGNGISTYIDNHNVRVVANTVVDTLRPLTVGHASTGFDNALVFERNLFVAPDGSIAAIMSWGKAQGMALRENVIVGAKAGLSLTSSDTSVFITGNVFNGPLIVSHRPYRAPGSQDYIPPTWQVSGNHDIAGSSMSRQATNLLKLPAEIDDAASGGNRGEWRKLCDLLPAQLPPGDPDRLRIGADLDCGNAAGRGPGMPPRAPGVR